MRMNIAVQIDLVAVLVTRAPFENTFRISIEDTHDFSCHQYSSLFLLILVRLLIGRGQGPPFWNEWIWFPFLLRLLPPSCRIRHYYSISSGCNKDHNKSVYKDILNPDNTYRFSLKSYPSPFENRRPIKKPVSEYRPRACKIPLASATRLSKGFAVANPLKITFSFKPKVRNQLLVSSWTRGFPSHDCSWFGFIGAVLLICF
jgi:hypothetical protein